MAWMPARCERTTVSRVLGRELCADRLVRVFSPPKKGAFECMYTLLDSAGDRLYIPEFIDHTICGLEVNFDIKGLSEVSNDVQMLSTLLVTRLVSKQPDAVLKSKRPLLPCRSPGTGSPSCLYPPCAELEPLCAAIEALLSKDPKKNAVKQEVEKNREVKQSAMRAVKALLSLTTGGTHVLRGRWPSSARLRGPSGYLLSPLAPPPTRSPSPAELAPGCHSGQAGPTGASRAGHGGQGRQWRPRGRTFAHGDGGVGSPGGD